MIIADFSRAEMKIILPFLLLPLASSLKPFEDSHVEIVKVSSNVVNITIINFIIIMSLRRKGHLGTQGGSVKRYLAKLFVLRELLSVALTL